MQYVVGILDLLGYVACEKLANNVFAVKEIIEKTKENNFTENWNFWKMFFVKKSCGCFAENIYLCLG